MNSTINLSIVPMPVLDQRNTITRDQLVSLLTVGPEMRRGSNEDGTPWMGTMLDCLNDALTAAECEAREVDRLKKEHEWLRTFVCEIALGTYNADERRDRARMLLKKTA